MAKRQISPAKKAKALALIDLLQEKYPKTFTKNPYPKVPLAVGTTFVLLAIRHELGVQSRDIKIALSLWCRGVRYWSALTEVGAPRYDIHGNIKGSVKENHAERARNKLEKCHSRHTVSEPGL